MLIPLLGFSLGSRLPEQFFPVSDRDMINFEVYLPSSASLAQTRALTERISASLADVEGIKSLHWFVGGNAPAFYYNLMQRRDSAQYYAQAMLTTDNFEIANVLVPALQRRLDEEFPEAQIIVRRLEQGPPFNAPVELRLVGQDIEKLKAIGDELRRRSLAVEDVVHVRSTLSEAVPKIWLQLDEYATRMAGLSLVDTAGQLRHGVDGVVMGSVLEGTQSLPVRVQSDGFRQGDVDAMDTWLLVSGQQHTEAAGVPLSALGRVDIRPSQGVIPRRDGERVNMIEIYIRDGVLPAIVLKRVEAMLTAEPLHLPEGFRLEIGGEDEKRDRAVGKLLGSMGLIVVLLVVSVVMAFNSFRMSAIIFIVAIQAAGLGMLGLSAAQSPFGFTSIIGLMGLVGLAINAAIVILTELKSDPLAATGDQQAIIHGVASCGRHIVSTTVTTVIGFMPLLLGGGGFWPPFAVVMAGGTLLTTVLSFYFVPAILSLMASKNAFEPSEQQPIEAAASS